MTAHDLTTGTSWAVIDRPYNSDASRLFLSMSAHSKFLEIRRSVAWGRCRVRVPSVERPGNDSLGRYRSQLLGLGDAGPAMASDTLHLYHVRGCFSELAAESVVDIPNHLHHHPGGLLCLFVIGSGVQRYLSICVGRRTRHLDMAVVAHDPKSHGELLHDLNNLLPGKFLGQHLKIGWWRGWRTAPATAAPTPSAGITPALALPACGRRLDCSHQGQRHGNAKNHNSEPHDRTISHMTPRWIFILYLSHQ